MQCLRPRGARCAAGRRPPAYTPRVAGPGTKQASAYRREAGQWLIEIRLRELRQLFHHLDPAPFREKDLDPAAEEYIEDAVREIGPGSRRGS